MQTLAVVQQIARFPVKSMRGEALAATNLTLHGVAGDRRYAFVQAASRRSFPWFTAREMPELLCYTTSVEENGSQEAMVTVTTPSGEKWRVDSEELRRELEARSGRALFLLHDHRGSFDSAPVSLISRETVARIAEESATEKDAWRFRPNLLVALNGGGAFDELNWVGRVFRVGQTARIAIIEPIERCIMITLDPANGKASPAILKSVVSEHKQCAGVYAAVLTPGEVRVGDALALES